MGGGGFPTGDGDGTVGFCACGFVTVRVPLDRYGQDRALSQDQQPRCGNMKTKDRALVVLLPSSVRSRLITVRIVINSLGTPPRLTFQARLLHNQKDVNIDQYVERKLSTRSFDNRPFRHWHPFGHGAIEPGKSV